MFSDWVQSIVIIILFSLFPMIDAITGGMQTIQDNWSLYRCTPVMLPFASYFAPKGTVITTEDNFSYCTQTMMASFAPSIMQPFSYLQSMTVDMMGSLNSSVSASTTQSSSLTKGTSGIIESLYAVFINVIIQFNILSIKMSDTQGKLTGIITTVMYIMTAVQYTFESMWNGVPGAMIKALGKK